MQPDTLSVLRTSNRHPHDGNTSAIFKYCPTRAGELVSPGMIYDLDATINYLEVGRWMHANGYDALLRSF